MYYKHLQPYESGARGWIIDMLTALDDDSDDDEAERNDQRGRMGKSNKAPGSGIVAPSVGFKRSFKNISPFLTVTASLPALFLCFHRFKCLAISREYFLDIYTITALNVYQRSEYDLNISISLRVFAF